MTYTSEDLAQFAELIRTLEVARAADAAHIAALTHEATTAHALNAQLKERIAALEQRLKDIGLSTQPALPPTREPEPKAAPPPAPEASRGRDLNGMLLIPPEGGSLWLVYQGRRHRVASETVFSNLFRADVQPAASAELKTLELGPVIEESDRLVRAAGGSTIYFARDMAAPKLHPISSYEAFKGFGFDEAKVREVPQLMLDALPRGPGL
jgi:hypothetical protein